MGGFKPFLLSPAYKNYIWGGKKLINEYNKDTGIYPLAESWECAAHPNGSSIVADGEYKGMLLSDLIRDMPEMLGTKHASGKRLPVLIKLIDAKEDLSIQVHPDDAYASEHENGQLGKMEMWYVLHADKGARLAYGFNRDVTREEVEDSAKKGEIEKIIKYVPVERDDIFFINPGLVHAIGSGVLLLEIQESSDLTYRLYDYDRVDKQGKKRELHIEKALDVANYKADNDPCQPLRTLRYKPGMAKELLGRCKYFQVERLLVNTERNRSMTHIGASDDSFKTLVCIDGCGVLFYEDDSLCFFKGDTIFIPAGCKGITIHGRAQLVSVSC